MTRREIEQLSFADMLLFGEQQDVRELMRPELRRIDELLDDEALVDEVMVVLRRRRPQSARRGRPATPAVVVLRMLVLKHAMSRQSLPPRKRGRRAMGNEAARRARRSLRPASPMAGARRGEAGRSVEPARGPTSRLIRQTTKAVEATRQQLGRKRGGRRRTQFLHEGDHAVCVPSANPTEHLRGHRWKAFDGPFSHFGRTK